ncbi:C-type lectin domain family 2 member D-like isoform X2 [Rana temporaria]|uniref:C-type lectin domain family 2 member D-like isoform X2 n=1 Tax=Rana temporaria TaxID=8407 RepID=UPI001AADE35F|nr:C-type lectin domain family 2 member D-like isoform X2 [Rana temporaria]
MELSGSSWLCRKHEVPGWMFILCLGVVVVIFLISAICISKLPHPAECPTDWIQLSSRCYYLSDNRRAWNASEEFCNSHGASLLVIMDNTKKDLDKLNTHGDFWIGLRRDQNKWKWVDGTDYDGKVEGYQNGRQLHCAHRNEGIGALDCSTQRLFICSKTARGPLS